MALQSFSEIEPVSHTVRHHPSSTVRLRNLNWCAVVKVLFTVQIFPDRKSETSRWICFSPLSSSHLFKYWCKEMFKKKKKGFLSRAFYFDRQRFGHGKYICSQWRSVSNLIKRRNYPTFCSPTVLRPALHVQTVTNKIKMKSQQHLLKEKGTVRKEEGQSTTQMEACEMEMMICKREKWATVFWSIHSHNRVKIISKDKIYKFWVTRSPDGFKGDGRKVSGLVFALKCAMQ